jgi:NADH-quinone oxidoreductase subunit E
VGALTWPADARPEVERLLKTYPRRRAALLPLLHLAQRIWGHVTDDAVALCAETVECSPADARGTASFYSMYHTHAPGRPHIRVCTNVSCQIRGADELLRVCERALGIKAGQTTPDGKFSLEEAECLGACDRAPLLMVNDDYVGPVDQGQVEALLKK